MKNKIFFGLLVALIIFIPGNISAQTDKTNADTYFKELLSPQSMICSDNCYGIFSFTAPSDGKPIEVSDLGFQFLTSNKVTDNSKSVRDWVLESNTSQLCEQKCSDIYDQLTSSTKQNCVQICSPVFKGIDTKPIQPGETRIFKITASIKDDIEWIPGLIVNSGTDANPSLTTVLQTKWALWIKGPYSNNTFYDIYHLNEAATPVYSYGSNAKNMIVGTGTIFSVKGVFNNALRFTGLTTSYANSTANTSFPINNPASFCLWFNSNGTFSDLIAFASLTDTKPYVDFSYYQASNCIYLQSRNDGNTHDFGQCLSTASLTTSCPQGTTCNLCVTRNASDLSVFINGVFDNKIATTDVWTTNSYSLGCLIRTSGGSACTTTSNITFIDEVLMNKSVFTDQQILDIYQSGITQLNITSPLNNTIQALVFNITGVIGFGDNSTRNLSVTNISGSNFLIFNQTWTTSDPSIWVVRNNETHWIWYQQYDPLMLSSTLYNTTYCGSGGNSLITQSCQSFYFNGIGQNSNLTNSFISQIPNDLDTFNIFGIGLNVTYFINSTVLSNSLVNVETVKLCYMVNNSQSNSLFYVNGSSVQSGFNCVQFRKNDSAARTYSTTLNDNQVYPAIYNINETVMETTNHTSNLLTDQNSIVKIQLFNVSNSTPYNFFEIMANCSGGSAPGIVYYCNSSYTTGNPSSNNNCASFGSLNCIGTYNHTHRAATTPVSSHQVFSFGVGVDGKLNNIVVTPTSYFIFSGANTVSWRWGSISFIARSDATQTSNNNGFTYSNFVGSLDAHIHQFTNLTSLWYYQSAQNQSGYWFNSSTRQDLMELSGLPPTAPNVYNPVSGNYSKNILINYTVSISPNGYNITYYVIKLYNSSFNELSTIVEPNGTTLGYVWDSTGVSDNVYIIGVYGCDSFSLCSSTGFSQQFRVDNTGPIVSISSPSNTSYLTLTVTLTASALDANMLVNTIWYTLDGGSNSIYTGSVDINTVTAGGHVINVSANDTLGNVGSQNVAFTTSPIPPYITSYVLSPLNIFYSQVTYGAVTLAVGDNAIDKVWLQTAGGVVFNVTGGVVGANNIPYYPNGNYGTYYVYAYANDTSGYSRTSTNYYTLVIQPPLNVSNNPATNNLLSGNPLKAAVQAFTNLLGGLFWAIIVGVLFVALWLRTNNFIYPTLVLFTLTTILGMWLPPIAQQISYAIYFAAAGLILYRLWSPSYTQ